MNVFLIIVLVLSGLVELVVGLWALLVPTSFADLWLRTTLSDPALGILLFVLGLASIYMAALHVTAIRWLQIEKQEGYHLSIALGIAIAVLGGATYAYAQVSASLVGQATYLLLTGGVWGIILTLTGIVAMRAPATVRELRVPGRRERPVSGRRRDSSRVSRETRPRRSRDDDRSSRRPDQRRRATGRESGVRSSRVRRDGQQPRSGSSDRRDPRRERTSVRSRESASDSIETTDTLRRRRLSTRDDDSKDRERRPLRRPRVPPLSETDDARHLGVVVTGERPDQRPTPSSQETRPSRSEPRRGKEERPQRPLAPMVPSLRTENGRSRRSDRDESENEREARGDRPRSRHRRHRSSSRDSSDREQVVGRSSRREEPFDRPSRPSSDSSPSGNRFVRNAGDSGSQDISADQEMRDVPRQVAPEPPATIPEAPPPASEPPVPASEPSMPEEPIDRISAFHSPEEEDSEDQDEGNDTGFGRQRRPYTRHRRGRQSKPRESKVRQSLGGDHAKEAADPIPDPPITRPESRKRRVGMENGIGPIDLDEPDSSEEE